MTGTTRTMRDHTLLVVDDDALVIESIRAALPDGWRMLATRDAKEIPSRGYRVAFVDLHLTGALSRAEGLEVIRALKQRDPGLEIIAMSGQLDRSNMELCLKAGATRFLAKPLNFAEFRLTLDKIEALLSLDTTPTSAAATVDARQARWIGDGPRSREIKRQIANLRHEGGPILIEGESGVGKDVCARLIHAARPGVPFVTINVASVPEALFESEFFGHVKGAFTGADQNKIGLVEAAAGGDLFLDEIETLSPVAQAKLLRFLESGEVRRVGAREATVVDVRVIAATNRDLGQMVREGVFREDLLWRINGRRIVIPPLRERSEDVTDLALHFFARDRYRAKTLGEDAVEALVEHPWPGNVRELKRVCEQLLLHAPLPVVRREDIQRFTRVTAPGPAREEGFEWSRGLVGLLDAFEARVINRALDAFGDIEDVARTLKISRSSLYKKIKDHDLSPARR